MTNSQRSSGATRRGEHRVGHDDELAWCGGGVGGGRRGRRGLEATGVPALGAKGPTAPAVRPARPGSEASEASDASDASEASEASEGQRRGRAGRRRRLVGRLQRTRARTLRPGDASIIPFLGPIPPPRPCRPRRRPSRRAPGQTRPIVASGWPTWRRARCCGRGQSSIAVNPGNFFQSSSVKFPVKKTRTLDQPSRASLEASTASHV